MELSNISLSDVSAQGLWASLAVGLIFYILKAQEKRDISQESREQNYQMIISNLADQLLVINEIKDDIVEIKNHLIE